jgi:hypothetical protein
LFVHKEKVDSILSKNLGYEQICEIEEILADKRIELPSKKSETHTNSGSNSGFPVRWKEAFPALRPYYETIGGD